MCNKELSDLSNLFNPVLRGWANYYGRFYPKAMKPLWRQVNAYLVRWRQRKYKQRARGRPVLHGRLAALPKARRGRSCIGSRELSLRLGDGSRMNREVHVRFCEGLGLQCPGLLIPTSAYD